MPQSQSILHCKLRSWIYRQTDRRSQTGGPVRKSSLRLCIVQAKCNRGTLSVRNRLLVLILCTTGIARFSCSFLDCIFPDCASCTANDFNCTWCVDTCHSSSHPCPANGEFDDVFNFTTKASTEDKAPTITPCKLIESLN